MSGRLQARDAIHHAAHRAATKGQIMRRGKVTKINPTLTVDVFGLSHPLTQENDFELAQWPKLYDSVVGIEVGDVVLMCEYDEWLLVEIISDRDVVGKFDQWDTARGPS